MSSSLILNLNFSCCFFLSSDGVVLDHRKLQERLGLIVRTKERYVFEKESIKLLFFF